MPAAIRIDIHLHSLRASDERLESANDRVRRLAIKLAQSVREAMEEFVEGGDVRLATESLEPPDGATDDTNRLVRLMLHPGLGPAYPPEDDDTGKTKRLGEGAMEWLDKVTAGEDVHGFLAAEKYKDGAYHVIVKCDLG